MLLTVLAGATSPPSNSIPGWRTPQAARLGAGEGAVEAFERAKRAQRWRRGAANACWSDIRSFCHPAHACPPLSAPFNTHTRGR